MKAEMLDRFQIAGFAISIVISVGLILAKQDTVTSVLLGLVLATLTQLFDLQLRNSIFEAHILKANVLSQALYADEWLLGNVQEIVDSYIEARKKWFQLFRLRAQDLICECRDELASLVEDNMYVRFQSSFSIGPDAINKYVEKSLEATWIVADPSYWSSVAAQNYFQANAKAIQRGVKITRIFSWKPETFQDLVDILERQQSIGVDVYLIAVDVIPDELKEEILVIDDRIAVAYDLTPDGRRRQERITIHPDKVERISRKFDTLMRHARRFDDVYDSLKQ